MKKGFTMIELIFVIVILGILASVAIPKLAATRDDAKAATIKTDIGTALNAIPAWYQGQQDVRIGQSMSLDAGVWLKVSDVNYAWQENGKDCVNIQIWDINTSDSNDAGSIAVLDTDYNSAGSWLSTAHAFPVLKIVKGDSTGSVCKMLWNDMNLTERNASLAGQRIKW